MTAHTVTAEILEPIGADRRPAEMQRAVLLMTAGPLRPFVPPSQYSFLAEVTARLAAGAPVDQWKLRGIYDAALLQQRDNLQGGRA